MEEYVAACAWYVPPGQPGGELEHCTSDDGVACAVMYWAIGQYGSFIVQSRLPLVSWFRKYPVAHMTVSGPTDTSEPLYISTSKPIMVTFTKKAIVGSDGVTVNVNTVPVAGVTLDKGPFVSVTSKFEFLAGTTLRLYFGTMVQVKVVSTTTGVGLSHVSVLEPSGGG